MAWWGCGGVVKKPKKGQKQAKQGQSDPKKRV